MKWDGRIMANALHIPLADESVQMCVTSPPYWGLRSYEEGSSFNTVKTGVNGMGRNQSEESRKKTDAHPSRTTRGFNDRWDEKERKLAASGSGIKNNDSFDEAMAVMPETRNKRSVWHIGTQAYPEAHYATFPEEIPETCIKAGSKVGDVVLDPFLGSGTVGMVAERLNRRWIGLDLGYQDLQKKRLQNVQKELML